MAYQPYPTDLTDKEWELIEPLLPKARRGGVKSPNIQEGGCLMQYFMF